MPTLDAFTWMRAFARHGGSALALGLLWLSAGQAPLRAQSAPVHVVQPGETLSEIAKSYGIPLDELMTLNAINDADDLLAGQTLRLPAQESAAETETEAEVESESEVETETGAEIESIDNVGEDAAAAEIGENPGVAVGTTSLNPRYTVRTGDTLSVIALRHGVDVRALRAINGMTDRGDADLAAGQTLILPATVDELRTEKPAQTYIVQAGDSLSQIAADNGLTLAELLDANGLRNPNLVNVGQELRIPPPAQEDDVAAPAIGPQRRGFYYYTVQPGDTLSELAKSFDISTLALLEFNNLPDEQTVYSGLQLRIPFGAPPLPQVAPPTPLSGTSFLVSLSRQECWLFEGGQVRYRWQCSTGYGEWITRTGTFHVQTRLEVAKSNAYQLDMPYWLGIYDVGEYENGIHGLPIDWETGEEIWDGLIGTPATFGCAMLDNDDAAVLFDRAYLGMPIHVLQ